MNFVSKLDNTFELLDKLDNVITGGTGKDVVKSQLFSLSEDLARYKDRDNEKTKFENEKIKSKITEILNKINEIEINVKNKLILTEKYNLHLNS